MGKRYRNKRGQIIGVECRLYRLYVWYYTSGQTQGLTAQYTDSAWPTRSDAQSALDTHAAKMGWEEVSSG